MMLDKNKGDLVKPFETFTKITLNLPRCCLKPLNRTIAHLGAMLMFGDTIIYDAQRQVTLNLKQ